MTVGDTIKLEGRVIENLTVKANTDIAKGAIVCNDGAGLVPATVALLATKRPYVALEDHDYSETSNHMIRVGVHGVFEVKKKADTTSYDIKQGSKLTVSSDTAGVVQAFALADVTSTVTEAKVEAAIEALAAAFGECYEDATSASTSVKIRL